jgi:eukaryotic translation initiation factor 2C
VRAGRFYYVYNLPRVFTEQECRNPIQLLMCILPGKRTHPYGEIKRISDTVLGIPTQCVQGSHTRRPNPQYIANVCLKMNAKLGGLNSKPSQVLPVIGEAPTIVFGADVSHPAPGETGKPSICAVVASIDQHATSYVSAGKG